MGAPADALATPTVRKKFFPNFFCLSRPHGEVAYIEDLTYDDE